MPLLYHQTVRIELPAAASSAAPSRTASSRASARIDAIARALAYKWQWPYAGLE